MKYDSKVMHQQAFERADHARYVKAAGKAGLTAWIQMLCEKEVKRDNRVISNRAKGAKGE